MKSKCCALCDSQATVFLTQVKGGKKQELALCADHALGFALDHPETYDIIPTSAGEGFMEVSALACPACGTSELVFRKKGRCGCPHCYEHLSNLILPHLSNLHAGPVHVGKVPRDHRDEKLFHNRLSHLHNQLKKAVASERYEDAAAYRDAISELGDHGITHESKGS